MTPTEEHADLTGALLGEHYRAAQAGEWKFLAVLDVLIGELPYHPPVEWVGGKNWCECRGSAYPWSDCPIVRAARAAVGASREGNEVTARTVDDYKGAPYGDARRTHDEKGPA